MKQQLNNSPQQSPYNKAVSEAYHNILKGAKGMLATIEQEELRHSLVRDERSRTSEGIIIHEFINPLIYLRLECGAEGLLVIHYGFEQIEYSAQFSRSTACFPRSVYRLTSKEVTAMDIEACVSNSWCITECSALYEYVDERMKYHSFQLIKYKPASTKRKEMKAVA